MRVRLGPLPDNGKPSLVFSACIVACLTVVGLLACQYVCEKLTFGVVTAAVRAATRQRLGASLEPGRMRAWVLLGRFAARASLVLKPGGSRDDYLLLIRGAVAELGGPWRLVRGALRGRTEVLLLRLEDIDVVLGSDTAAVRALAEALGEQQGRRTLLAPGCKFTVKQVIFRNIVVQSGGDRMRVPDMKYEDFSKAMSAGTLGDVAVALVAVVARAALAGVAMKQDDKAEGAEEGIVADGI